MIARLRTPVNIGFFVLVAILVVVWLFLNHIRIGPAAPPMDQIRVEFEQSPGIAPGFPVTFLGIPIGSAGESGLEAVDEYDHGIVVINILIDPSLNVPDNVHAIVKRRSAVGEPYVDLVIPEDHEASATFLADGDTIPLARTDLPPTYEALFDRVEEVLSFVDTDDFNRLLRETATGFDGTADTVRKLVDDLESVTGNFAARAELFDDFFDEISRTTNIFASRTDQLGSGFDDLVALSATIRESRADLTKLIDGVAPLQRRTAALVRDIRPGVECLLPPLITLVDALDDEVGENLRRAIAISPRLLPIIQALRGERAGFDITRIEGFVDDRGTTTPFDQPLPNPVPPRFGSCGGAEDGAGSGGSVAQAVSQVPTAGGTTTQDVDAATAAGMTPAGFQTAGTGRSADEVMLFLASALLLLGTGVFLNQWLRPAPAASEGSPRRGHGDG